MGKTERVKYLIIGNSAGGIGTAEAIREVDKAGSITIVSDEPYPVYSRPLISKYLAEKRPLERILFRPSDFYEDNRINTFLGRKAEELDTDAHAVLLDDDTAIVWEKLLLATGGLPIVPPMEGSDSDGVFTFTTLDDARAIDRYLAEARRTVVIGGGLIGVSVTEALVKRGIQVTIVEMMERILSTILDEETSALETTALEQSGVSILTGQTVTRVDTDSSTGRVNGVTLDDGTGVPCELVVVAIGVRPRTGLVASAGININRGIVVDRHMRTSLPDIYACGDAAEVFDFIHGENRVTPIWPNAYLGGRVAGFNMAGVPTEYQGGTAMNSMNYFGLAVTTAGIATPPDGSYTVVIQRRNGSYKKVVLKDGLVVGMVFARDVERSGIVFSLMKDRVNVQGLEQALVADDFGLVSLPEEIWRSRLEVPSGVGD
jgi:NAD(P)H-nitrite reductase large subunit